MGKIDNVAAASEIIERDKSFSKRISLQERESISGSQKSDDELIRYFFQDHFGKHPGPTTNLPHGAGIGPYLLLGGAPVVDLQPHLDETSFRRHHGMSFYEAEMLADEGLIVPNLYWRNKDDWRRAHDGLNGLIKKSIAVGERVDRFLNSRYPKNASFVSQRYDELEQLCANLNLRVRNQTDLIEREIAQLDLKIAAIRWGYLQIYAPMQSKRAFEIAESARLPELFDHLIVQKWLSCTHITGALGGSFVLGPGNLDLVYRSGRRLSTYEADSVRAFMPGQREILEYLWSELSGTITHKYDQISDLSGVVDFLKSSDNLSMRNEILSIFKDLGRNSISGRLSQEDVFRCKELVSDYERRIEFWGRTTQTASRALTCLEFSSVVASTLVGAPVPAFLFLLGLPSTVDEILAFSRGNSAPSVARTMGEKYVNSQTKPAITRTFALVKKLREKAPIT